MINGKRVEALVPLRGGSKSIPQKNIKLIAGRPLCEWVLIALLDVEGIDGVHVSTEDDEIARLAQAIDPRINIIKRPSELATDEASTESVMLHFAEEVDFDILITAQATSPLTTSNDIKRGLDLFFSGNYDSLLTGVRQKRFYWNKSEGKAAPVNYDYKERPRRQDFDGWILENGAFYITSRSILLKEKCRLGGKIGILEMAAHTAIEIDDPVDWIFAESLLIEQKQKDLLRSIGEIKLLVVDVDGTLTDAGMYYSSDGESLKKFNTRDAKGLELVQKEGIMVSLMTSEDSEIVRARAKKLRIKHTFIGVKDKMVMLENLCKDLKIKMSEIAYIGDDLNDFTCIENVGLGACPADALSEVKNVAKYICQRKGGKGAVREFCEIILNGKKTIP
jgi:YrbI family 3-deoxy-D-manno-octulosonate 8-phosphate phosphatase